VNFFFKRCPEPTTTTTEDPWWTSTSATTNYPEPPPDPVYTSPKVNFFAIGETCSANFITQDYNEGWERKVDYSFSGVDQNLWPVRLTNKLFVYLMAFNMFESNGLDINERQLETSACFVTKTINDWSITNTTGFGGKSVLLRMTKTNIPRVFRFHLPYGPLGSSSGTASIILSDNNAYNIFEFCFDNGLRTFAMFARKLGDNDMDSAKTHLKAIGFKERNFIDLNPDLYCNGIGNDVLYPIPSNDIPKPLPQSRELLQFVDNNSLLPVPPLFWKKK